MSRRIGLVVNPERSDDADTLADRLSVAGFEVVRPDVGDPDELGDAARSLADLDVEAIAALGGDGTQRSVAAALAGTGVPLLVCPGGTVNLLGRVLGIDDLDASVAVAVDGTTRHLDVGDADGTPFLLNASSGWDATVIAGADDATKRFGRLGFTIAGIREWLRTRPGRVTIDVDGRRCFDGAAVTVMVMNVGERASASATLAPDASFDDGRLDVVVLRRHSFAGLVRAAVAAVRRRRAPERDVVTFQGAEIGVRWASAVDHQVDGDGAGTGARFAYAVRPSAVTVRVPTDGPAA